MGSPRATVIAVVNQKGGVGKTTTTINVAAALGQMGYRTLVVDMCHQADATTGLGLSQELEPNMYHWLMDTDERVQPEDIIRQTSFPQLWLAPAAVELADFEWETMSWLSREKILRFRLRPLLSNFDFILVDTPPNVSQLTLNALAAADYFLIPITAEWFPARGLARLMRVARQMREFDISTDLDLLGIVVTMYDGRMRLTREVVQRVREAFGDVQFQTVIRRNVRVAEAQGEGKPVIYFDPKCVASVGYIELAKEVLERVRARVRTSLLA